MRPFGIWIDIAFQRLRLKPTAALSSRSWRSG
jgi:hypothetical protein